MRVRDLATVTPLRTPDEQWRENQQPAIFVTAQIKEGESRPGVRGRRGAPRHGWPEAEGKLPSGHRWELGGHYIRQQQAFQSLLVVMVVAVLLVFIMLAFQFRSVVLPLLIFLTQPLSLVSGLLALWLTDTHSNVSSYMGAILLIGLDMKNGILLVEYIQQLRREGMALAEPRRAGGPDALPADPDDQPGGHPRPVPAGPGHRPGWPDAAAAGHHGHRRPDGQHAVYPHDDPGRLPADRTLEVERKNRIAANGNAVRKPAYLCFPTALQRYGQLA